MTPDLRLRKKTAKAEAMDEERTTRQKRKENTMKKDVSKQTEGESKEMGLEGGITKPRSRKKSAKAEAMISESANVEQKKRKANDSTDAERRRPTKKAKIDESSKAKLTAKTPAKQAAKAATKSQQSMKKIKNTKETAKKDTVKNTMKPKEPTAKQKEKIGIKREKDILKRLKKDGYGKWNFVSEKSPGLWIKWGPLVRKPVPLSEKEWKRIWPKLERIMKAKMILLEFASPFSYHREGCPQGYYDEGPEDEYEGRDSRPPVDCAPNIVKYLDWEYLGDCDSVHDYVSQVLEGLNDWTPYEPIGDPDEYHSEPETIIVDD